MELRSMIRKNHFLWLSGKLPIVLTFKFLFSNSCLFTIERILFCVVKKPF